MDRIQSKAARLQRLEHRLYNAPRGMRVADLAEYCGVDRRTIYRDLQALEEMGAPIWEAEGRYGIDRESYLSTIRLNLNEAVALFFAARLLAHHSDEHNPNVVSALNKLAAGLPDTTISSHMARVAEIIRARPLRADYVRVLDTITRAWADRRKVAIRYRAASGELTERVICPYFLEVSRSEPASYVIAYDDLRAALRTFKLERVAEASLLESSYAIPDDFDPYAHLAAAWGVMDEVEVEVRLRFSPAVAPRVRESVWHHSQELHDTLDGGCDLRMRVGGIREVRSWVLSWGGDVEVLAPPALRDEVAAHARRMIEQYAALSSPE
ncbi:MAG TPA: WYL domain-containing protein [Kouleothrix sp.]|uniref:helix-turn-helix transcriptional regulator n=1 Tax=Kouleothrix sp. TaxID=2779161 RepID=UPI002BBEAEAC|nr:WYL domain-containing protein [Kouleothrix sp.]HRC76026.1 WYL domain-containing protein [Kouleothrix sp.]